MFIKAKIADHDIDGNYSFSGFIEPKINLLADNGLLVNSSMCLTENRQLPVRIVNLTDAPIHLYKNKVLGNLHPIDTTVTVTRTSDEYKQLKQFLDKLTALNQMKVPMKQQKTWYKSKLWEELRIDCIEKRYQGGEKQIEKHGMGIQGMFLHWPLWPRQM